MKATKEHKEYLNKLRESGVCNMFGMAFGLTRKDTRDVLTNWMEHLKRRTNERIRMFL